MAVSIMLIILLCISLLIVAGFFLNKWLSEHYSHWYYFAASNAFKLYVAYKRRFDKSVTNNESKVSLELRLMDNLFRKMFKKDFSNHSFETAKKLLDDTRSGRKGFLKLTMPPIKDLSLLSIKHDVICSTRVLWILNNDEYINNNALIISLHGGAYVSGNDRSCLPYLIPICLNTKINGLSINYGLGPENPLPYSINQTFNIIKYFKNNNKYNNIILIGDSAGASLIILLMQKIKKGKYFDCFFINF